MAAGRRNVCRALAVLPVTPGGPQAAIQIAPGGSRRPDQVVRFTLEAALGRVKLVMAIAGGPIAALREGDYTIRVRGARYGDALGEAAAEVNALADNLREQRLGAMEATALLQTVIAEIDVAIFAFDIDSRLKLVNRAGERLEQRRRGSCRWPSRSAWPRRGPSI